LDIGLKWAKANGKRVRWHTFVWQNQTPLWFFKQGYSRKADAPWASRETMLARLDNYVKAVMDYCKENYPGIVYAIDVVNEAIEPDNKQPGSIRSKTGDGKPNPWFETVGPDYIDEAFVIARRHAEDGVKLFYNDYNTYQRAKTDAICVLAERLRDRGLLDGVGMQSHVLMGYPTEADYRTALERFGALGVEVQATELDIPIDAGNDTNLRLQGLRYRRLMTVLKTADDTGKAKVTNVTVWGLEDGGSWLNEPGRQRYPLLFTGDLKVKPAFYGFAGIKTP
jgi:endo-1,4-beta-xylanase